MANEHHLQVRRTARYYTLGEASHATQDVWFVCHGYGQLASDFVKEFEIIAQPERVIVAPEALSRNYAANEPGFHSSESKVVASWMTREDRENEIADYVAYLDAVYDEIISRVDRDNVSITALGFSQGGATANRWVTRGHSRVDRLIMWGALIASDADLNQAASFFRDVKLTIVYGKRDQFLKERMIEEYAKVLRENGIPFEFLAFEGGHRMDRDTLTQLASNRETAENGAGRQ
jgi:predicted esterase